MIHLNKTIQIAFLFFALLIYPTSQARVKIIQSRVGATDILTMPVMCVINPNFRRQISRKKEQTRIHSMVKEFLVPPTKHSTWFIQSEYLGVLALVLDVPLMQYDITADVSSRLGKLVTNCEPIVVEDRYDESEQEDDIEVDDDWRSDEEGDREDDISEDIDWFERRIRLKRALSPPYRALKPLRRRKRGIGRRRSMGLLKWHKPLVKRSSRTNRTTKSISARNFNSDGQDQITAPVIRLDHEYEEDMWTMGQPEDVDEYDMPHDFFQYKDSGAGVAVYVVDDGCDFSHPEFEGVDSDEWIFPSRWSALERTSVNGHGTSVAGKIVGKTTGIAQHAKIITVKDLESTETGWDGGLLDSLSTWIRVHDHIKNNRGFKGHVINFSSTTDMGGRMIFSEFRYDEDQDPIRELYEYVFEEIMKIPGVLIVVPAGNEEAPAPVNKDWMPQYLAARKNMKNLIVVAGHDTLTGSNAFQTARFVKISAPAVSISVPIKHPETGIDTVDFLDGTSFAAPAVSGMLAMWISAGVPPDIVVDYMHSVAWDETDPGIKKLFTGITQEQWPDREE